MHNLHHQTGRRAKHHVKAHKLLGTVASYLILFVSTIPRFSTRWPVLRHGIVRHIPPGKSLHVHPGPLPFPAPTSNFARPSSQSRLRFPPALTCLSCFEGRATEYCFLRSLTDGGSSPTFLLEQ